MKRLSIADAGRLFHPALDRRLPAAAHACPLSATACSGAPGGVMVYVNNGGFGPAQGSGLRLITDEDDGRIVIDVPTAVTEIVVVVAENAGNSPWYWLSLAMIMIGVSWWLICRQFSGPATERKIRTHSCPPLRTVATRSAPYRSYTWR